MKARCVKYYPLVSAHDLPYLTVGKEYEVLVDDGELFEMLDDGGTRLCVLWQGSSHGIFEKVEEGE
jgi:hypothetical protein